MREQHPGESRGGPGTRANGSAHTEMSGRGAGHRADSGACARSLADLTRVAGLIALRANLAFVAIELGIRLRVGAAEPRSKIARDAVGQRDGIEAQIQLGASMNAAAALGFGDGGRNGAARRNYDPARGSNRIDSVQ